MLSIARETGGVVASVTEDELVEGIELLAASEGIFAETAGGVTVAVLRNLAAIGRWQGDETVVAYITGAGPQDGRLRHGEGGDAGPGAGIAARGQGALSRPDLTRRPPHAPVWPPPAPVA